MDQLRRDFEEYMQFLRQALAVAPLRADERRARRGWRLQAAQPLARAAARAQRAYAPYLQDLGQSADDLRAQHERVVLLRRLHRDLLQFTADLGDTLLREQGDLLQMGLAVLEALQLLLSHAELPPALRRRMSASLAALRRHAGTDEAGRAAAPAPLRLSAPRPPALPAPRRAARRPRR